MLEAKRALIEDNLLKDAYNKMTVELLNMGLDPNQEEFKKN